MPFSLELKLPATHFSMKLNFRNEDKQASFTFAKIKGGCYFTDSLFGGEVLFYGVRIGGELRFQKARFKRSASFKNT